MFFIYVQKKAKFKPRFDCRENCWPLPLLRTQSCLSGVLPGRGRSITLPYFIIIFYHSLPLFLCNHKIWNMGRYLQHFFWRWSDTLLFRDMKERKFNERILFSIIISKLADRRGCVTSGCSHILKSNSAEKIKQFFGRKPREQMIGAKSVATATRRRERAFHEYGSRHNPSWLK